MKPSEPNQSIPSTSPEPSTEKTRTLTRTKKSSLLALLWGSSNIVIPKEPEGILIIESTTQGESSEAEYRIDQRLLEDYRKYISEFRTRKNNYILTRFRLFFAILLLFGLIYLSFVVLYVFYNPDGFRYRNYGIVGVVLTYLLALVAVLLIADYHLSIRSSFLEAKRRYFELRKSYEEKVREEKESRLLEPGVRFNNLSIQYRELTNTSAKAFFESRERYNLASIWRREAGELLTDYQTSEKKNPDLLNEVQYLLDSLSEIVDREIKEQKGQSIWRVMNIAVICSYIALLIGLMLFTSLSNQSLHDSTIPLISIPSWALVWGALGSLSAILYRFYNYKNRIKFSVELQWIIARPIIGILMSAVAYLSVQSGVLLLGAESSSPASITQEGINPIVNDPTIRFTAIVCFLAGFSDKFYLSIINLLVSNTVGNTVNDTTQYQLESSPFKGDDYYANVLAEYKVSLTGKQTEILEDAKTCAENIAEKA